MSDILTDKLTEINNHFVNDILEVIGHKKNTLEIEYAIFHLIMGMACAIMGVLFEYMEEKLYEMLKGQGYQVERRDERTINFLFGAVTFKRRRIRRPSERGFYLLDRRFGFPKGKRYSGGVIKVAAELSTTMVTRSVADAFRLLTPVTMSHQTVTSLMHYLGKAAGEYADAIADRLVKDVTPSETTVLAIEGDGLMLGVKNGKKKELHRVHIYEGGIEKGSRRELVKSRLFADTDKMALRERVSQYLDNYYLLGTLTVISNGDGGPGYDKKGFQDMCWGCREHIHVRDDFHVNKKIRERLSFCPRALVDTIIREQRSLNTAEKVKEKIPLWLDTAAGYVRKKCQKHDMEQIERLRSYLERNIFCLKSLVLIEQRNQIRLGTAESNHRIYSYRMKRQGRSWSEAGLKSMANLITARKNGELDQALLYGIKGQYVHRITEEVTAVAVRIKERSGVKSKYRPGMISGGIGIYSPSSSPMAALARALENIDR